MSAYSNFNDPITVRELIEKLSGLDPESHIYVYQCPEWYTVGQIEKMGAWPCHALELIHVGYDHKG